MKRLGVTAVAGALALSCTVAGTAEAANPLRVKDDSYRVQQGKTLQGHSVLANDAGAGTLVSHTAPAHGTLKINPDGSFSYTPEAGFTGTDSFTYSTSDAVKLYRTNLPPLATIDGVTITGGSYGSSLTPVPGKAGEYYGLTDRGPNVDGPDGEKVEPLPGFTPAIGRFQLVNGKAVLKETIPLRAKDGTPYNGQANTDANTGETIVDRSGNTLPASKNGYDSEGLVALPDGTFWVSDEYGPFITHFDAQGRAIERLSPFDGSLPAELANRVANKGMEGLTVTPDGHTLVGIMQSALQQPDLTKKPGNVAPVRIVTYDLRTRKTREYLYLLDNPKDTGTAVSEITALDATHFLVDERDGEFEPGAYKKLYKIDLSKATDVGPSSEVKGATYDAAKGGLLVGGRSIEVLSGTDGTDKSTEDLAAAGITPVAKSLAVDVGGLVTMLDPSGGFFGHDKVEGVATTDGGRTVVVSNDSDFGIDGVTNDAPPYELHPKTLPDGTQDDGEFLAIDTTKLPAETTTATVRITVTEH
ncbi:esterase-like activity of phytase family protein [Amycolatopsis acidicola]|uniref:Esterase-like activity of phytase family protein n=1 Tax=Amycolatopsis acidicola TaxID=2596893 RepID=A0A5N0UM01_9PSEU|nr:esterase-like activity of phytase family protein [Amycolatopsis acidicola]KAA9150784.1 esterase-like activity of phytase family protein [Amycolatopsis acidicola]